MNDVPGLSELRARKANDFGLAMSLPPLVNPTEDPQRKAAKQIARTLDAQQSYIDQRLAAAPKPKRKQDALMMKLEALRNERLGREDRCQLSKSNVEVQPAKDDE